MPVRTLIPPNKDDWYDESCRQSGCSLSPIPPPVPPPPPPPASSSDSHERANFVTGLIVAGSALVFVVICLSLFLLVSRRRQQRQRRRREALLEAALAPAGPAAPADGGLDLEEAGGEIVHHAWHIRTVGLDEEAIESIALTRYRAGAGGVLGASDCAVCLGEFADGELLRLLPKCAHAFHVWCIDTWLRAHVNCPLCRSHVLDDPTPAPAAEQFESPAATDVSDTGQAASSHATPEQGQTDRQASEQRELQLQMDQHDGLSTSPDQPHRHPGPRGRSFRRVASMDSPSQMASAQEAAPETDEQAGGAKQGTGRADHCELVLSPGCSDRVKNHRGMKRSLSVGSRWALVSRHCRRSSSLLPL